MKEQIEKAKTYVSEHKTELQVVAFAGTCFALGCIIGQWSLIPKAEALQGYGAMAGIHYAEANGVEAAMDFVRNAHKFKI